MVEMEKEKREPNKNKELRMFNLLELIAIFFLNLRELPPTDFLNLSYPHNDKLDRPAVTCLLSTPPLSALPDSDSLFIGGGPFSSCVDTCKSKKPENPSACFEICVKEGMENGEVIIVTLRSTDKKPWEGKPAGTQVIDDYFEVVVDLSGISALSGEEYKKLSQTSLVVLPIHFQGSGRRDDDYYYLIPTAPVLERKVIKQCTVEDPSVVLEKSLKDHTSSDPCPWQGGEIAPWKEVSAETGRQYFEELLKLEEIKATLKGDQWISFLLKTSSFPNNLGNFDKMIFSPPAYLKEEEVITGIIFSGRIYYKKDGTSNEYEFRIKATITPDNQILVEEISEEEASSLLTSRPTSTSTPIPHSSKREGEENPWAGVEQALHLPPGSIKETSEIVAAVILVLFAVAFYLKFFK